MVNEILQEDQRRKTANEFYNQCTEVLTSSSTVSKSQLQQRERYLLFENTLSTKELYRISPDDFSSHGFQIHWIPWNLIAEDLIFDEFFTQSLIKYSLYANVGYQTWNELIRDWIAILSKNNIELEYEGMDNTYYHNNPIGIFSFWMFNLDEIKYYVIRAFIGLDVRREYSSPKVYRTSELSYYSHYLHLKGDLRPFSCRKCGKIGHEKNEIKYDPLCNKIFCKCLINKPSQKITRGKRKSQKENIIVECGAELIIEL